MVAYSMEQWAGEERIAVMVDDMSNREKGRRSSVAVWLEPGKKETARKEVLLETYDPGQLHSHLDFVEIFYVHEGYGVAFLDGTRFILQKGDIVCVRPGQVHANYPLADMIIYNCLIRLERWTDEAGLAGRLARKGEDLEPESLLRLDGAHVLEVEEIFRTLFGEYTAKEPYYEEALENGTDRLLLCLMRFQHADGQRQKSRRAMAPLLEYLSKHYKTVTLEELAAAGSYHPSYLSRLFRRTQGMTFTEYVNRLRMNEAVRLLTQTDLPVEEIAAEVGFGSRVHFYEVFKKQLGMTPGAVRKKSVFKERGKENGKRSKGIGTCGI